MRQTSECGRPPTCDPKGSAPGTPATRPLESLPVAEVRISDLRDADSARTAGINAAHVRALAQVDTALPPIMVHHPTMRIVDGMHRVAAARLNGQTEIAAVFCFGNVEDVFRLGVQANVAHGLPLSLPDRRAAATRIIRSHPELSDRTIAASVGLSARTIAAVRDGVDVVEPTTARVGRDGRIRPVSAATGRRAAAEILSRRPETPLREIARATGISVSTAHDVRVRLVAGRDPVPRKSEAPAQPVRSGAAEGCSFEKFDSLLQWLHKDPSLRYSDAGKAVLRLLGLQRNVQEHWQILARKVPPYCIEELAEAARHLAVTWAAIALDLSEGDP